LLLDAGRVWVKTTQLLRLFPCEHTVGPMLVLCSGHLILVNGRQIGEVRPGSRRTCVNDLDVGCQLGSMFASIDMLGDAR
jgi:hypothetical protein